MDSLRSFLVKLTPSAAAATTTSITFKSPSRSLQSLSCSPFLLFDPTYRPSRNVSHLPARNFHFSRHLASPRFKLNISKPLHPKSEPGEKEGEEKEGDKEKQGYLKSHPYRKLLSNYQSKSELAQYLLDNVIYSDHGLFVTNKPFGVGVRNPTLKQRQQYKGKDNLHLRGLQLSPHTLEDVVPELAYLLNKPTLCLARSTEKLTSGIAVFADDEEISKRFLKCVSASKVYYDTMYKYHVVTVLPPLIADPHQVERVGITVQQGFGSDIGQPVLLYDYSRNSVKRKDVVAVHCQMKLVKPGHVAGYLVELNTSSVVSNFLRVQCADKLAPILGDHLYSSRVQTLKGIPAKIDHTHLKPGTSFQKLTKEMQTCLELKKPEDSLFVPTHSHLRSYKVRKFVKGNPKLSLEFVAPYPSYFQWTCKQLGIILEVDDIMYNSENVD